MGHHSSPDFGIIAASRHLTFTGSIRNIRRFGGQFGIGLLGCKSSALNPFLDAHPRGGPFGFWLPACASCHHPSRCEHHRLDTEPASWAAFDSTLTHHDPGVVACSRALISCLMSQAPVDSCRSVVVTEVSFPEPGAPLRTRSRLSHGDSRRQGGEAVGHSGAGLNTAQVYRPRQRPGDQQRGGRDSIVFEVALVHLGVPERRACRVLGQHRSTQRKRHNEIGARRFKPSSIRAPPRRLGVTAPISTYTSVNPRTLG